MDANWLKVCFLLCLNQRNKNKKKKKKCITATYEEGEDRPGK